MSTARRRLKSPRSLSGTSAHPTMVTQVNIMVLNGWLTPFSFHVNRPIPEIKLFQTLTLKLQGQGHGCGERSRSHIVPRIKPMHFLFVSHQSDQPFLRYGQNSLTLKKHIRKFVKITVFNIISPKSNQVITMTRATMLPCVVVFRSVVLALLRRKFLLIDATVGTLGQGQGKVIQYISPDPYILCAKYERFSSNCLTWEGKVFAVADAAEMNWKHKVTPDRGDLIKKRQ